MNAPVGVVEFRDEFLQLVHVLHVADHQHVAAVALFAAAFGGGAADPGAVLRAGGEHLFLGLFCVFV